MHRVSIFLQDIKLMRNFALPIAVILASLIAGCGGSDNNIEMSTIAVIGDVPYGTAPADESQTLANPAFISAINSDPDTSLVLHVGDIHAGKQYCTSAYNLTIFNQWKAFKNPLVYTPGDNEWTDCHKAKEGGGTYNAATGKIDYVVDASGKQVDYAGGEPLANLDLVRSVFFASPGKALGGGSMTVHSQALEFDPAFPADKSYVENVWWEKSKVLFVTLNMPGGSNNDRDPWYGAPAMTAAQTQEVANRSAADLRWLDAAFKQAAANGDIAVVIQIQADMWDLDGNVLSHVADYKQFVDSIALHTTAFGKPVLLFNGDSHVYRSDNPLVKGAPCVIEPSSGAAEVACSSTNMPAGSNNPSDPYLNQPNGYNVPNFHRVVVHGSTTPLEWLKLTIDPYANAANRANAFGPFSWKRVQPKL
jgi:hypothetical protein